MKYTVTIAIFVIAFLSFSLAQIPTDSLVAYYPFNGNANDESGNGNNGVTNGGVTWATNRFGNSNSAAYFNGTDGVIESIDTIRISNNQPRTISCWLNIEDYYCTSSAVGWGTVIPDDHYKLSFIKVQGENHNRLTFHGGYQDLTSADGLIDSNRWYHVVFTYDGSKGILYSNAIAVDSGILNLITDETKLSIGYDILDPQVACGWNTHWKGKIDDVSIYNRALSESEIQTLYHDGLVAYYPFNANANDESSNGNNGTLIGGVTPTTDRFGKDSSAFLFDGSTGYIHVENSASLQSPSTAITLCGWALLDSYNGWWDHIGFINKTMSSDYGEYHLMYLNYPYPQIYFAINGSPGSAGNVVGAPTEGIFEYQRWYFVATTWDGDTAKIFVDGKKLMSAPLSGTITSDTNSLLLGVNTPGWRSNFLKGKLDDIRIYNRALSNQEIRSLYGNYRQQIVSIKDIPNDQGGKVRIKWDKIYLDSAGTTPQITSYGVWRKIPPGMSVTKRLPSPMSILNDTLGVLYDYLGTVNATQSLSYNFVAQTLQDSSESGTNAETFLITAHTSDPNVYYISDAAMGYSVDNIAPSAVTSLAALWQTGPYVDISWDGSPKETDFQRYEIYKSTTKNFVPSLGLRIETTINPQYQDADVADGYRYYYQVYSVDSHGNKSEIQEISIHGNSIPRIISLNNNWNMVSVPMDMDDYSKESLFPTVVSSIFKFDGSYQTIITLENGTGYWAKFDYPQDQTHNGFYLKEVRINVKDGWNMIGSLSETVPVTNITSEPAGMVTSQLFEYSGSYQMASNLNPGKGYWIKVSGPGTLILSNGSKIIQSNRINITKTDELPPLPPFVNSTKQLTPKEYVLEQNFPNPFNPTTIIKYGLPEDANVTLSVFNTLGQEVALLASGFQKAGYHEVTFDGAGLTSGVYFYRIQSNSYLETKKLLLMK